MSRTLPLRKPMRRLEYNQAAQEDLLGIARFIRASSGHRNVASAFAGTLRKQCEKIAMLPGTIGRPRAELRPDLRSFAFKGYLILFSYTADAVVIVNIIESHRDIGAQFEKDTD